jgi:hypothetical protein
MLGPMGDFVMTHSVATAKHKQKRASIQKENRIPSTKPSSRVNSPASLKKLFAQRDAAKPGSKEESQAVDRIMKTMFPNSHAAR